MLLLAQPRPDPAQHPLPAVGGRFQLTGAQGSPDARKGFALEMPKPVAHGGHAIHTTAERTQQMQMRHGGAFLDLSRAQRKRSVAAALHSRVPAIKLLR